MRFLVVTLSLLIAMPAVAQNLSSGRWIDLTHSFAEATIYWPNSQEFTHEVVYKGMTERGFYYTSYNFSAAEHGGTHIDAPIHFAEGKKSVDQIAVDQLIGPAVVIDVVARAEANRDYQVGVADLEAWESAHGRMPDGCIVLLNTGSSRYWPDRRQYMGTDLRGDEGVAELHFPGLHPDAARWLVEERTIGAVGLDTPSIDYGPSTQFESHVILFKANVPALENVANLEQLPPVGALVLALPMKIAEGSGAPTRIVAFIPE
jgi:kynurenine formamidase